MSRRKPAAVMLPHNKKLILWVTSPNGYWMLLSGHWTYASECKRYAAAAGYTLIDTSSALAEIEQQMQDRANRLDADLDTATDVTRVIPLASARGKGKVR